MSGFLELCRILNNILHNSVLSMNIEIHAVTIPFYIHDVLYYLKIAVLSIINNKMII